MNETTLLIPTALLYGLIVVWLIATDTPPDALSADRELQLAQVDSPRPR